MHHKSTEAVGRFPSYFLKIVSYLKFESEHFVIDSKIQAIKWNYPEKYKRYIVGDYVRVPQSPASPVARSVKSFTPPVGSVRGVDVYCVTCEKHTGGKQR